MEAATDGSGKIALGRRARSIGSDVLRFLDLHWLEHSPANYAFAHRALFGDDETLKREVDRMTNGGLRITPAQVAALEGSSAAEKSAPPLDHITLRVLDVIGGAATETRSFNQDLIGAATALVGPSPVNVNSVIGAMIDRTAQAETRLAAAARQVRALRDELNALGGDANRDRLTGLLNRNGATPLIDAAVASSEGCVVALLGVDRLQLVNNDHGHLVGDRLLRTVAEELIENCRPHLVARWQDDVFLVLMEGLTVGVAGAAIDRARTRLTARQLTVKESGAPLGLVSFSAGVAASRGRRTEDVVASAAALLEQAKSGGRNRVEVEPAAVAIR